MRAEIKSYYADESVGDPLTYQSRDADVFGYTLTFSIGPVGQEGADNFEVIVTTPKDLQTEYAGKSPAFLRHCILVDNYNFSQILRLMTNYVNSLEAESWEKLVEKLSRVALWEFEDYRP
jgi:hypothetical protein